MSNELIRIVRTLVQAVVAMAVAWLAARGIDIDVDVAMIALFPIVMAVVTAAVQWASQKAPFLGQVIALLNGPPREVTYSSTDFGRDA